LINHEKAGVAAPASMVSATFDRAAESTNSTGINLIQRESLVKPGLSQRCRKRQRLIERKTVMASKPPPKVTINRSAKSGQFVTPQFVKKHPSTTVTEHYPAPKKK